MTLTVNLSDRGGAVNLTRVVPKTNLKIYSNRTIMKEQTKNYYINHNYYR